MDVSWSVKHLINIKTTNNRIAFECLEQFHLSQTLSPTVGINDGKIVTGKGDFMINNLSFYDDQFL